MRKSLKRIYENIAPHSIAAILALAILYGCNREHPPVEPPVPVRLSTVSESEVGGGIRYSATISAFTQVTLAFKSGGYVDHIFERKGADGRVRILQVGDPVSQGQVLAHVREAEYADRVAAAKAQLAQVQATAERTKLDFERASSLLASASLTKAQFDAAKASFDSSTAALDAAKAGLSQAVTALNDCSLRSPISGWVLERDIEVGSLASVGTQAFTVADTRRVKALFGVPDTAIQSIHLGAAQAVTTSSLPGEFHGRITAVSPSADPRSRVFSVEVTIPNPDNRLKPGMIATLALGGSKKKEQPAMVVPLGAVVRSSKVTNGFAVFVVDDRAGMSLAHEREVQLGDTVGNTIVVTQGLQLGERVVVTGATQLKDGDRVQVIP